MSLNGNNQPVGYTYDPSGNMTVEPLSPPNDMTYDGENRMTALSGFGGAGTYTYDGNGLRVVKSSGGTTTVSIFSGSSVIAEYDNGAAPSAPSREYIYNSAGGPTAGLLAMISGGTTTYYHQDHLSVRLTTDANGNPVTQEGHFPFGEQWYETGPTNKWFFTSYNRDSESVLDYALARYYDSRTGTFLIADPLTGDPSDPQSWNRYAYGRNDPIDNVDPSGKSWWSWLALGGAIVGDYFTFGALTGAVTAELHTGIQIGIDATAAAASAAGTAIAARRAIDTGQPDWGNAMNETLGMPHGWSTVTPGSLNPYSGIGGLNQSLDLGTAGCEFGACGGGLGFQEGSDPSGGHGFAYTAASIAELFGRGFPYADWTDPNHRLYGTHYCGPGGGGSPVNGLDRLCQAHDMCYTAAGLSAASQHGPLTAGKNAAMTACNQSLCDGLKHLKTTPGTQEAQGRMGVSMYFTLLSRNSCHF